MSDKTKATLNNTAVRQMDRDLDALIQFTLEKAEDAPARVRVRVYRALSEFIPDQQQAINLKAVADSLESIEHSAREFRFRIENPNP